jgi:formylglycine-generating enzyme required for sulfatase activity
MASKTDDLKRNELLSKLENIKTSHRDRADIGEKLVKIGDTRHGVGLISNDMPEIEWCYVEAASGDNIRLGSFSAKMFPIRPFYIAKYLITNLQFQAFLDDPDGFHRDDWWDGIEVGRMGSDRREKQNHPSGDSYPRGGISWYQAVAFCRWLNAKLSPQSLPKDVHTDGKDWQVRLPMESEWQWAAQGGKEFRLYPWGQEWIKDHPCANTGASTLNKTTVVGMYPDGQAKCGALDMSGNLFEWCIDMYKFLGITAWRVRRGGAFDSFPSDVRSTSRDSGAPNIGFNASGLRVVYAPSHSLNL